MPASVTPISPPDVPRVTPRDLRVAGEAAEAMTEKELVVVCNAKNELEVREPKDSNTDQVVLRLYADPDVKGRLRPRSVKFTAALGSAAEELVDTYDAVFWSEAAFKKFLFSYYHGMRLLTPEGMQKLREAYANPLSIAFAHAPKSVPTALPNEDPILQSLYVFKLKDMTLAGGGEWLKVTDPRVSAPKAPQGAARG